MKRLVFLILVLVLAMPAFAKEGGRDHHKEEDELAMEMQAVMDEYRDRTPASLTFGEMEEIAARLSVPQQKRAYVKKLSMMSFFMPGAGQFKGGDPLSGSLFLAADLAVVAGTTIGLYFLLPPELRFDQLDYFNSTADEIDTAWETAASNATLASSWQFWGVATGGMVLKHIVSHLSARHAGRLAMENIENGTVTFEPHVGLYKGMPGFGFGMKY